MNLQPLTISILDNYKDIGETVSDHKAKIIFNYKNEGFLTLGNSDKTLTAFYELSEEEKKIPEFGIYDLGAFMKIFHVLKTGEGFSLKFEEKFVVMKSNTSQQKFFYSPIDLMPKPPNRKVIEVEPIFTMLLKGEDIEKLKTMAKLMTIETVLIEIKEKNAIGIIKNVNDETSNVFKLILGKCDFPNCPAVPWKLSLWLMMKGVDYKMSVMIVKEKRISKFEAVDGDGKPLGLIYYIGTQAQQS